MTRTIFIFLFLALTVNVSAQTFEGKIVYKISYKSKIRDVTDAQLTSLLGYTQNYFIKGGSYKSESNGTFSRWQLYVNRENRLYNDDANSETILWDDGSVNDNPVTKTEIKKSVGKILGFDVDAVILTTKMGVERHYVSTRLAVDSKLFVNHQYGNWHHLISQLNALPLKFVLEAPEFILEAVAVEVKEMKLDDKFFELPASVKTIKRPTN